MVSKIKLCSKESRDNTLNSFFFAMSLRNEDDGIIIRVLESYANEQLEKKENNKKEIKN